MEDVKTALKGVEWTFTTRTIDKTSSFPMVLKPTAETAGQYEITQDPVLLHHYWITQRLVAQSLEDEGAYVVGPQMEISADYTGTFQYRHDLRGNNDVVQGFATVKDIALAMPEKVFVREQAIVYPILDLMQQPPNREKIKTVFLNPREQLTVLEKTDINTVTQTSRFAFPGMNKLKQSVVPCVVLRNEVTKEILNLPLTTKGKFTTVSYIPAHGREYDFKDIVKEMDLPMNLETCRNCPQTLLDEHFLRPGMRLRITAIEEHEVIIGVTTQGKIVEFSSEGVDFKVPKHLDNSDDKEQEIAYQTAKQRFLMECQIKNSPVNIRDYRKSIRNHVSRVVRLTAPKVLSMVAATRMCKFISSAPLQNGLSAIALLSSASNSTSISNIPRRSSLPSERTNMPLPAPPMDHIEVTPPLPPRNSRKGSSLRAHSRPMSTVSPIVWDDFPSRPPPPPPTTSQARPIPTRQKSHSASSFMDSTLSSMSSDEQIWGEFDRKSKVQDEISFKSPKQGLTPLPYENVALAVEEMSNLVVELPKAILPPINLDDIERAPSPEFSLGSDDDQLLSILADEAHALQTGLFNPVYENMAMLHNNNSETVESSSTELPSSETVQSSSEGTEVDNDVHQSLLSRENSVSSYSSKSSKKSGAQGIRSEGANDSAMSSTSSTSRPPQRNGFRMSQYSVVSDDSSMSRHISFTCNYVESPDGWTPPDDVSELTVDEVTNSLRYIGMNEDMVDWFRAEKVDGQLLCCMDDDMLTEHFHLSPFQRKKLILFLKGWRPKFK